MFRSKQKEDIALKPANISELMDHTATFMLRLRAMGGFGYVLFGVGFLIILILIIFAARLAADLIVWLTPLSIILLALGVAFVLTERIIAYKMAQIKLNMIVSVTEQIIVAAIPKDRPIDGLVVKGIIKEALSEIWGMWIPDDVPRNLPNG